MMNVKGMLGMSCASDPVARPPGGSASENRDRPGSIEADRPHKKPKVGTSKMSESVTAQASGVRTGAGLAERGPGAGSTRGAKGTSRGASGKAARPPSMRDLCRTQARTKDEPFHALSMGELPEGEASDPLEARWLGLTRGNWVWTDGSTAASFIRGGLHPKLAQQVYSLSSEVLIEKSAKSLVRSQHYHMALIDRVQDAGRVITSMDDKIAELRSQVKELKAGATPKALAAVEQRAANLEAKVARLKSELGNVEQERGELRGQLKESRAHVRSMENELLEVSRNLEAIHTKALAEETRSAPEKNKKLIEDYKRSHGFQLGLQRSGRLVYEYGYRVAMARFRARYPDLQLEENPFVSFPEDNNVDMPDEVPFDDSVDPPKA